MLRYMCTIFTEIFFQLEYYMLGRCKRADIIMNYKSWKRGAMHTHPDELSQLLSLGVGGGKRDYSQFTLHSVHGEIFDIFCVI